MECHHHVLERLVGDGIPDIDVPAFVCFEVQRVDDFV